MPGERDEEALLTAAKPAEDDPSAQLLRARLKASLQLKPAAPPKLGRFTILERVGAGAMGTVYAAYDPVLDRRVALKVLQRGLVEARSLAKLSHPNVVSVFDAGEHEMGSYIAMEYVQGETLRDWLTSEPRSVQQILDVFLQAGQGLWAAHQAGIVHSDFKPENVLVGEDRARVADFGLAQRSGMDAEAPRGGTLAYMAPQMRAGPATFASDQYAFCVALYEALSGERPSPAVPQASIPSAVFSVLQRGLQEEPEARYQDLGALLAALSPKRRPWPALVLAGLVSIAALLGTVWSQDACGGGAAMAQAALSSAEQLSAQWASLGGYERKAAISVQAGLARYSSAWGRQHRGLCEALRVQKTISDATHDARMECLEGQLRSAGVLLEALASLRSSRAIAKGVREVAALQERLRTCGRAGSARKLGPSGLRVQKKIERARVLFQLGQYASAQRIAEESAREVEPAEHPQLAASAWFEKARTEGRTRTATLAQASALRALSLSARAADDPGSAKIWVWLLRNKLFQGRYAQVIEWAPYAKSAVIRGAVAGGSVEGILGEAQLAIGRPRLAQETIRRAIALEAGGSTDRIAIMRTNLGAALAATGDLQQAQQEFDHALRMMRSHLGAEHPGLGFYLEKVGRSRWALGDAQGAQEACRASLSLREEAYGPEDRAVATSALCLARAQLLLGELKQAALQIKRAAEIRARVYGESHPSMAQVHGLSASLAMAREDWPAAIAALQRAVALQRSVSKTHPQLVRWHCRAAEVYRRLGQTQNAARAEGQAKAALGGVSQPSKKLCN